MKKQDLIRRIAENTECSQKQIKEILDVTESTIHEVLREGEDVTIVGVKFATKVQKGRDGVSPMTGQAYHTEDKIVPRLKATASLKKAVL